jgi:NDP-sugar pyrophosphorylase family protein
VVVACYDARVKTVSTAYVLAAGLGTRLRPLTNEVAKPLVEVCGSTLLDLALGLLARAGVTRVGVNSHWLHPQIPNALEKWRTTFEIATTHEPEVLGTGGGLRGLHEALPAPPGERVLVLNGDALIDIDLAELISADRKEALATLVLKEVPDVDKYGAIGTRDDDVITDFAGRAVVGEVSRRRMFCGVHLVDPSAFSILPLGKLSGINDDGYPVWMKRGEILRGFDFTGTFCDVGTPERLLEANLSLLSGVWGSMHLAAFDRFQQIWPQVYVAKSASIDSTAVLAAPALVDEGAVIGPGARVDGSVVGRSCRVESGASLSRSAAMSGAVVRGRVENSVVAPSCTMTVS